MTKLEWIRTAAVTPVLKVGNTEFNINKIIRCIKEADNEEAAIIVLPELCITGYTCGDLFFQEILYQKQLDGLRKIALETKEIEGIVILGFYLRIENRLFNCAALLQKGQIKGIVPKFFLMNSGNFNESRWFTAGFEITGYKKTIFLLDQEVPFGNLLFQDSEIGLTLGIDICLDSPLPISPGSHLCLAGAHILCSPSASHELVGKSNHRRNQIIQKSRENICGYIYASSGVHESTTDLVYSGHCIIGENGHLLGESPQLPWENTITYSDIDYGKIRYKRAFMHDFQQSRDLYSDPSLFQPVALNPLPQLKDFFSLKRTYSKTPFIPESKEQAEENCREAFNIQSTALAKRIAHINAKKLVLGISGGLDSTLALLVAVQALKILNRKAADIIAITMPGFGTTKKTLGNALTIMKLLRTEIREIPISESVLQHFSDISHDPQIHNEVYENSQARERTQILMDIANKEKGLQLGTGDLSERALGWCTFNGDHMGMYNVNGGVPKTLIRVMIKWFIDYKLKGTEEDKSFSSDNSLLASTLQDILDTPISPELFPPDAKGNITQRTEDTLGPYLLHDFFLYHTLRSGVPPKKLLAMGIITFKDEFDQSTIKKWLGEFYRRFFSQQFKRNCSPDGPKVGTVGLSPRSDWQMPSDGDVNIWLQEL
ncbi:MAG: NAD(+) synthase [Eubacteriales bacterium]|nr:NAD(+) synthase [Eubacteriales bacterium]